MPSSVHFYSHVVVGVVGVVEVGVGVVRVVHFGIRLCGKNPR